MAILFTYSEICDAIFYTLLKNTWDSVPGSWTHKIHKKGCKVVDCKIIKSQNWTFYRMLQAAIGITLFSNIKCKMGFFVLHPSFSIVGPTSLFKSVCSLKPSKASSPSGNCRNYNKNWWSKAVFSWICLFGVFVMRWLDKTQIQHLARWPRLQRDSTEAIWKINK